MPDNDPRYLPDLFDFSRLFVKCRCDELTKDNVDDMKPYVGFRQRARILVTGEAGAGKTTFVLAMLRSMIAAARADHFNEDAARVAKRLYAGDASQFDVYYLSTEVRYNRLKDIFAQFGWFTNDSIFSEENFHVPTIPEDSIRLPMQGPQDLIDLVLHALKNEVVHHEQSRPAFVVVDTLTAMLKDSRDPGERRREAGEFMNRVEEAVGHDRLALMLLLAERSPTPEPVAYAEEVVADFVFRLGRRTTSGGRWQRSLALTKCAGVNMTIGDHSWAVLGHDGIDNVIAVRSLREDLMLSAMSPNAATHQQLLKQLKAKQQVPDLRQPFESERWATVAVFPVSSLPPIGKLENQELGPAIATGTEGLDEMLLNDQNFWVESAIAHRAVRTHKNALKSGTTTLVLGTAGTGKSTLCLQFLAHEGLSLPKEEREKVFKKALYIDFENPADRLKTLFPNVETLGADMKEAWDDFFTHANIVYRHRSNLDLNVLLAEIRFVMRKNEVTRVVVDGLSDLLATTDTADYARLVETLLWTLRTAHKSERPLDESARPVTTFVTFELPPQKIATIDAGHLGVEGLSASADNVIVLQQLSINDELRRTIYILKARAMNPDRKVREIVFDLTPGRDRPLAIGGGLETYTGLLNNRPEPVRILLQLFAENSAERDYNAKLATRLVQLFRYDVKMYGFSESSITRTYLDMISQTRRVPPSDIKVLSLDEWWIRDLTARQAQARKNIPLLSLDPFLLPVEVTSSGEHSAHSASLPVRTQAQFWVWEIEKASMVIPAERNVSTQSSLLAVPHSMDFGLFCVNTKVLDNVGEIKAEWPDILKKLPRRMIRRAHGKPFGFAEPEPKKKVLLVDWMAAARDKKKQGFAFDSETTETIVCTFLEFCWNFGARENFLEDDAGDADRQKQAAKDALHLLQYLVYHKLMLPRPNRKNLAEALFTRHWYSTLTEANSTERQPGDTLDPKHTDKPVIMALPFMPLGDADDTDVLRLAFGDLCQRLERLVYRMLAAVLYRRPRKLDMYTAQLHVILTLTQRCLDGPPPSANEIVTALKKLRAKIALIRMMALKEAVFARGYQAEADLTTFEDYARSNGERGANVRRCLPAAKAINIRDILELLRWFQFRADMIESQIGIDSGSKFKTLPSKFHPDWGPWLKSLGLTGYCCAGSWMLGVERQTHSPHLSWKVIEEATSLDEARERAEVGAGMPARKDFHDSHGDNTVPYAAHLKWKELLLYAGSRARRRDRIVSQNREIADIFGRIIHSVMHSLTVAAAAADISSISPKKKQWYAEQAERTADKAIEDIFEMARPRVLQPGREGGG